MKVLVAFPRNLWETKMSFVRRDAIVALGRHTDVSLRLSGPGWPDWDVSESLHRNMRDEEVIFWYKPDQIKEPHKRDVKAVVAYNECWWAGGKAFMECKEANADYVICHHEADLPRFTDVSDDIRDGYRPQLFHIPHATDCALFAGYSKPWAERKIDVLLTGVLSPEIYPLRCRVAVMMKNGLFDCCCVVRKHPGYRLSSLESCEFQKKQYASLLGDAKVVVVCSSIYGYGLAKYVEAAAAGAVVCGDQNADYAKTICKYMATINNGMSDSEIVSVIDDAVVRGGMKARQCQRQARLHHSMTKYAESLYGLLRSAVA